MNNRHKIKRLGEGMSFHKVCASVFVFTFLFVLSACQQTRPKTMVDEVIILNQSSTLLTDVALKVPATHALISCNIIPHMGHCSVKFPVRANKGNPVLMQWKSDNTRYERPLSRSIIYKESHAAKIKVQIAIKDHGVLETKLMHSDHE